MTRSGPRWFAAGMVGVLVMGLLLLVLATPALAHEGGSTRGAPTNQVVVATAVAALLVAMVAVLARRYRRGGLGPMRALGARAERASGLPGWASLPVAVTGVSLLVAMFGLYWDVSLHIDRGRDNGPFGTPAHWFIIVGLAGMALAGVIAVVMGAEDPTATSVRLREGWHAPVGGLLLLLCGGVALAGFPLDDVWHSLFGQDVTLWGPTHIQMIGGASLATLASWVLVEEGRRHAGPRGGRGRVSPWLVERADVLAGGAFMLGLSTLQAEFDFGVPQFRQLFHPVLIMLAASIGLVAVRVRAGRGGALKAVLFFLAARAALAVLIAGGLGRSTPHFPLYLVEAGLVELAAVRFGTDRQVAFGLWAGVLIGTVGLASEWAWSHVWMPLPWHASLWPGAGLLGLAAAVAGGVIGATIGRALMPPDVPRQRVPVVLPAAAWLVALSVLWFPLPMTAHTDWRAAVSLRPAGNGWATASVRLEPPGAAKGANWFDVTAWQGARGGRGGLVVSPLSPAGPGSYRTTDPFPVSGRWKSLLRLQVGSSLEAVPIYLPADPEIPAPGVPAPPRFVRPFEPDKNILQREAVGGSRLLQRVAYGLLGALGAAWLIALGWGLRRLDRRAAAAPDARLAAPRHAA